MLLFSVAHPLQAAQTSAVRASNLTLQPGEAGNVVVSLEAQGTENAVGFSLSFDPTLLHFTRVVLANDAPAGLQLGPLNLNDAASGRLAVIVNLPAGQTFPTATQPLPLATLAFTAVNGSGGRSTAIRFTDQPLVRKISDPLAAELPGSYGDGSVIVNAPPALSDFSERTINQNGSTGTLNFTVGDMETAAGSLSVTVSSSNPTLVPSSGLVLGGAGVNRTLVVTPAANQIGATTITVTVTDAHGGVTSKSFVLTVPQGSFSRVRAGTLVLQGGASGSLNITLDAQGFENALGFSLSFDASLLQFTGITLATGAPSGLQVGQINANAAADGRVAVLLNMPFGQFIPLGTHPLVGVGFTSLAGSTGRSTAVTFGDQPVARQISDAAAKEVGANYVDGSVIINAPPAISNISPPTLNEGQTLNLTASATDPDLPAQTLILSLDPGTPTGMSIIGTTGAIAWTPTEAQGPGNYPVIVRATDSTGASATRNFTVHVNEVNQSPVLAAISTQTVIEGNLLTVGVTASDPDVPGNTLTFSLDPGAPAGASIDAVTGVFSWTPTEAQGPGSATVTVRVADNGVPPLSAAQSFTVTVAESNLGPVIPPISSQTIAEGSTLSLTVSASDSDIPANPLTFSLGGGAPSGASLSGSGSFSWTPTEAQGPGNYSITVQVVDGAGGIASQSFAVTVTENNAPPSLSSVGAQSVNEGSPLTVNLSATDSDQPPQALTFGLEGGAPPGAGLSPSGVFTWTPSEAQGPGNYNITVRVNDSGGASVTGSFSVTVSEVNQNPVFAGISSRTIPEGSPLAFAVGAADQDQPPQSLTYNLEGAPSGASIDAISGVFAWTPGEAQGPGQFNITVRVADNAGGSAAQGFAVTVLEVNAPPGLAPVSNQAMKGGERLQVNLSGNDSDLPAQPLIYSLPFGGPLDASVDSVTGVFSWTPPANHPGGTESVTVQVADSAGATATQSFSITVSPSNLPPVLAAIANQTVDEVQALSLSLSASDANGTAQRLSYALDAGNATGATLNSATGVFSWTPSEAQGPGSYTMTVRVSDDGVPPLSDTKSFTVTVNEVNNPPTVQVVANQTIDEGSALSLSVSATDADVPAQILTFSLEFGAPAGMTIDPASGAIAWTPTEAQGPSTSTVTVRVSENGVPPASQTVSFTVTVREVNNPPDLAAISAQTVAEGAELSFTASATDLDTPPQTITYSLGPGAPAGVTMDPLSGAVRWTPTEAQGPGNFTMTVRATDNATPPARSIRDVAITVTEVNRAPVLAAISNQNIAQGDTLRLDMKATDADLPANALAFSLENAPAGAGIDAGSGAFTWSPAAAQAPSQNTITVRVIDNGTPPLSDTKTFTVNVRTGVNLPPTITQISNQTVPENTPTAAIAFTIGDPDTPLENLKVSAASSNPTLVPPGSISVSGSGANWTVRISPALNQTGTAPITVQIEEPTGGKASATFVVTVELSSPRIVRQPEGREVLAGREVVMTVVATGSQPLSYQWQKDGSPIPGATGSSLVFTSARPEDSGVYSAVISNRAGTLTSSDARVAVNVPLRIAEQPQNQAVLAGAEVILAVKATGKGQLRLQWKRNGADLAGATSATLTLSNIQPANDGDYTVDVTDESNARVTSQTAKVTVTVPPTITRQPQSQTVAAGQNVSFNVEVTGTPPVRIQWQFKGVDLSGATGPTLQLFNVTVSDAGDYAAVVTNPGGTVTSAVATLTVNSPPTVTRQPQSQPAKAGASATFVVTASGTEPLSYQWRFSASGPAPARNNSRAGQVALSSRGLTATPPGTAIAGATSPTLTVNNVQAANEGDYFVVVTNPGGSITSGAGRLTVLASAIFTQQPQNAIATAGGAASFSAAATGSQPLAYQWRRNGVDLPGATQATLNLASVQPTEAGIYQVLVTNPAGLATSDPATLTVNIPPVILTQPRNVKVAAGTSAGFSVVAAGTGPFRYQWQQEGANIPGATGPSFSLANVQIVDSGSYKVVVSNTAGSAASDSATLEVITPPSIQTHPVSQSVNLNQSVSFTVAASGDQPLSIQWLKNGQKINGATGATYAIGSVQPADSGSYSAVAENSGGSQTSNPATLSVLLPSAPGGSTSAQARNVEGDEGSIDGGASDSGNRGLLRRNSPPTAGSERWFSWTARSSGIVSFNTAGSTFDTELAIYTGIPPNNLTLVGQDDDRGGFFSSEVRFNAVAGRTYLVSVKGFGGAAGRIVVSYKLQSTTAQLPVLVTEPASQTVSLGANVTLNVVAQGTGLTYQWLANGGPLANATNPTLQLNNVQEKDALRYTVRVRSGTGAQGVEIESLPAIIQIGAPDRSFVDKFKQAPRPGTRAGQLASYSGTQIFNTFGSTKEQGEPNHADIIGGASQWLAYETPVDGAVRVSTEGSDFDTVLGIYSGTGSDFASLKLEASDNNSGADGKTSVATFRASKGVTYFIAVDGVNGTTGTVRLSYSVGAGPSLSTQPTSQSKALGESFALFVLVTNALSAVQVPAPPESYQWYKNGFPISGQINNNLPFTSAQAADAGDYTVLVSNFAGKTTSLVARVSIHVPLSVTRPPENQTVRAGETASFLVVVSGSEPISYQWRLDGNDIFGATQATLTIQNVQAANTGTYTVFAKNAAGSVASPSATLSLNQAPAITVPPVDQTVALGEAVTFSVTASGTPPLSYQWRFNGVHIPGAAEASLAFHNASPAHVGEYTVVVSNNTDSKISTPVRLTIRVPLRLVEEPSSPTVTAGSSVVLSGRAAGAGPFSYQWRKGGVAIANATASTLTFSNVQAADAGQYTVVVTSGTESVESRPATLTVGAAPVITQDPAGQAVFAGTNVTFAVNATGTGVLAYQWFKDGVALAGATNNILVLENVQGQNAGIYQVTVSNESGSAVSDLAVLTVRTLLSDFHFDVAAGFQFRLNVPEGRRATVQISTDLINWVSFTPTPVTGVVDIQDPQGASSALNFYRIIVE